MTNIPAMKGSVTCTDGTPGGVALCEANRRPLRVRQVDNMDSIREFTGGVAHDINNLLTVIALNLEAIEAAADSGRVRQMAATARRATDRSARLTSRLLAASRRQVNRRRENVNRLVSEFQDVIRQAVAGGCEVRLKLEKHLWLCDVDSPLLESAVLNLALNGRDAMLNGGVLVIETRNVILSEARALGPYVSLSVKDAGCGIHDSVKDQIFEPFFTTKGAGKGTGLGLSMVHAFARQSGGFVVADSVPDEGTTVTIYLPRADMIA